MADDKTINEPEDTDVFDFSEALRRLKLGKMVTRVGWNNNGLFVQMQFPDESSKMTLPYVYLTYGQHSVNYPQGARVPWVPTQTDMLSDDWKWG